jgi:chromosomal replication initiation ATPase DnaA
MAEKRRPRLKDIVQAACEITGTRHSDLIGPRRYRELVIPRQMVAYIARGYGYHWPRIGAALNREHTTALFGAAAMEARLAGECGNIPEIIEAIRARAIDLTAEDAAAWTRLAAELAKPVESDGGRAA